MNKRLIALVVSSIMLLSAVGMAAELRLDTPIAVDAIAAATGTTETTTSTWTPTVSAPVVVTGVASQIGRLLALNSVGNDVALLQTLLNKVGNVLKVDGIFGPKTLTAVEKYQGQNGLAVDGIVGPRTLAKMAPLMEEAVVEEPVVEEVPVVEEPVVEEPVVEEPVVEETEEEVDAVSGASIVDNNEDFLFSITEKGNWITAVLKDLTFEEDLVLVGDGFESRPGNPDRKIGLYSTGDDDEITRFTLTAPRLFIKATPARLVNGTFVGDVYVEAEAFKLSGATIEGNLYFLNEEAKSTFIDDNGTVTGKMILIDVDATASASITRDKDVFIKSISPEGNWITTLTSDMTFEEELVLDGQGFENRGNPDRKIGLYSHPADDNTPSHRFTLTAPKLTIKSSPARMLRGTFVGDIYVEADNFLLQEVNVIGNVYFLTESALETFVNTDSTVSGVVELAE